MIKGESIHSDGIWHLGEGDMVLVTATGFNDQGKVLAVPHSCLLSSVLPFVEVNSNSLCLGQRCRNWGGKLELGPVTSLFFCHG